MGGRNDNARFGLLAYFGCLDVNPAIRKAIGRDIREVSPGAKSGGQNFLQHGHPSSRSIPAVYNMQRFHARDTDR